MTIEITAHGARFALFGGLLIGLAATLLLFLNGRIAGICGITNRLLILSTPDKLWRITFLAGLILGGFCFRDFMPESFALSRDLPSWRLAAAGILVGFGASLGSGCTSGHGVCGISRGSKRSILATITFIATGIMTVVILRACGVLS